MSWTWTTHTLPNEEQPNRSRPVIPRLKAIIFNYLVTANYGKLRIRSLCHLMSLSGSFDDWS